MKSKIGTTIQFDAAHFIPEDPGKCQCLHGHHWVIDIEIMGIIQKDGMIINFKDIKETIEKLMDHKTLIAIKSPQIMLGESWLQNHTHFVIKHTHKHYILPNADISILPIKQATAENLAEFLRQHLSEKFKIPPMNIKIRAWESPKSYAETV